MLTCKKCKQVKPPAEFPTRCDRNVPLKQCKTCVAAEDAARLADATNFANGLRQCAACAVTKPLTEFSERTGYGRGPGARQRKCKACVNAYSARYYLSRGDVEKSNSADGHAAFIASGAVTRTCPRCQQALPLLNFVRDRRSPDGFKRTCRSCDQETAQTRAREARARPKTLDLRRYGITEEIFDAISASQGHRCRVCGISREEVKDKYGFHVDHNHTTGHVRGLLCRACNTALGSARDSPAILCGMLKYLELTAAAPAPGASYETWLAYLAANEKAPLAEGFSNVPQTSDVPKT